MFLSLGKRMQSLLDLVDDALAGGDETGMTDAGMASSAVPAHPHRRAAAVRPIERRHGVVASRQMHCLSPVRSREDRRVVAAH